MQKILFLAFFIASTYAQVIHIKNGWQNIGATEDINTSTFNNKCVDYIWRYDSQTDPGKWKIHIANGNQYDLSQLESIDSLSKTDGFWVKGNDNCTIEVNANTNSTTSNTVAINSSNTFFSDNFISCPTTLPNRGTEVLHLCDCQNGADPSCISGDDNNDGTANSPKKTLSLALGAISLGQSVALCRGGSWIENSSLTIDAGQCSKESPCTLEDYGDVDLPQPLIQQNADESGIEFDPGSSTVQWEGVNINNIHLKKSTPTNQGSGIFIFRDVSHINTQCLNIEGFGIGVYINKADTNTSDITLKNSYIHDNTVMGWLGGTDNAIIEGNHFHNNGYLNANMFNHNIYVSDTSDGMIVKGNKLTQSAVDSNGQCLGVSLNVHNAITNNILIENNLIEETNASAGCWGLMVDAVGSTEERHTNAVIRGNIVKNVGNQAIGVSSCIDCTIENNIIVQTNTPGSIGIASPNRPTSAPDADVTGTIVRNNTVYFGEQGNGVAYYVGEKGTNYIVTNNIAYNANPANGDSCFSFDLPSSAYDLVSNNLCYGTSFDSGTTGMDTNAITQNPLFVNAPFNLNLQNNSPAIDAGYNTFASTYDINNTQRDLIPDIGAYEYIKYRA